MQLWRKASAMNCPCQAAGFCPVFQRVMTEEDRETCQRPGDRSERIRNNWRREAGLLPKAPEPVQAAPEIRTAKKTIKVREKPRKALEAPEGVQKLLLINKLCLGDCLVSTAAIECLNAQYPGKFLVGVEAGNNQSVFDNNPHIHPVKRGDGVNAIDWHYPLIHQSNQRPVHFLEAYVSSLSSALGVPLELSVNRPYLYLTDEEKTWMNQVQEVTGEDKKFWLLNCSPKPDFETKTYLPEYYQAMIDHFHDRITFVQIGLSSHTKTKLGGVVDLVGRTDNRQLIRLAYHAQGGLGASTALQHLMAAFEKPYVLVDSGREPASWMSYPNQTSLVRHGCLPCNSHGSCWKTKVFGDGKGSACELPYFGGSIPITTCTSMISPDDIIKAIERYYVGGRLTY